MKHCIVMLGAPGSGKGTQAVKIVEKYRIPHISSGDMFRAIRKSDSELGRRVAAIMDSGALVPDDVTIQIVKDRLMQKDCENGFILDGFPRTLPQAIALDEMLSVIGMPITCVPYLHVNPEILVDRLSSRWTCPVCNAVFSAQNGNKTGCTQKQNCDSVLYRRPDDEPATVANRVKVFEKNTAPLISYYKERGLLKEINGEQTVASVSDALLAVIAKTTI